MFTWYLETNPELHSGRVVISRRQGAEEDDVRELENALRSVSVSSSAPPPPAPAAHPPPQPSLRTCELDVRLADATLHVRVSVPGEDAEAQPLAIPVGKDFFIETTNALQKYDDHAKINFSFGVDSPFFEDEDAIPLYCEEARVRDLCCRSCRSVLLTNAGERAQQIESFQLPSEMWNSFSDCIACEECFPLRMSKIAAKAGRVYWSHLYGP